MGFTKFDTSRKCPSLSHPTFGEMSDQLKCKHLQLPSQNGQLFETNQERTRTKFFRSFPLRACDALNRDSKPWTTCVWRVPLRRTKRAALRCQLPQFVVCRSFSLMFCECTFLFSEFTVLRLGASPPFFVKCATDVATRGKQPNVSQLNQTVNFAWAFKRLRI